MEKLSCKEKIINMLFPIGTAIVAVVWIIKGVFEYGIWDEALMSPADGCFPTIIATVLLIVSIINIFGSLKEKPVRFEKTFLILTAAIVLIYVLTPYLGFVPTLFIFYVVWLKLYAKETWRNTIIATVVMFCIVYFAFTLWLKIRFPEGSLFAMLR